MIPYVLLACFLLLVFVTDMTKTKIPNRYTIPCACIGLLYYTVKDGWSGLLFSLTGLLVGFGMLTLLYVFRAVGAGDVKLFAAIGALSGTSLMLQILMYAIFYSGIIGVAVLLARRPTVLKLKKQLYTLVCTVVYKEKRHLQEVAARATHFPFMLAVMPGAITAMWLVAITS